MLYLYNTLTRKTEEFKPLKPKKAGIYTCGPTVYNFAHIGNLRTYIFEDILKRVFLFNNYKVKHVMNLTDVDDKTIKNSQIAKAPLKKLTAQYTRFFKEDNKKLNILSPAKFAPATGYIKEMVKIIQNLLKNKIAYTKDNSVYFSINKFKDYGRLSQLDKRELKTGATVDVDEYEKADPADFVLWKAWTEKDGMVFWQTAWGKGRPGWHIECSAISTTELGQPFDIHAGAVDLIFPHHENEIAQAEASTQKKFVNYWLHGEHLMVDGQKMSKSLNNFYTLRDIAAKGLNPLAFRYLTFTAHYRSKMNFILEALQAAQNALDNLYQTARELKKPGKITAKNPWQEKFLQAVNDDLNMPQALAVVWEMLKADLPEAVKAGLLLKFDEVLGLDIKKYLGKKIKTPARIQKMLKERELARANKDWLKSDEIREAIKKLGFIVEVSKDKQIIKPL